MKRDFREKRKVEKYTLLGALGVLPQKMLVFLSFLEGEGGGGGGQHWGWGGGFGPSSIYAC